MEITLVIFSTLTGLMYKLKQDYGAFYDKRLSLLFLSLLSLTLFCSLSFILGLNIMLINPEDTELLNRYSHFERYGECVFYLSMGLLISWFCILFLPVRSNEK
ncbi:hypothetical protein [Vibrio metschnikovii]|uniref:hypothetical protein n=1 Tax=Vibrio metschnikovii TaxID=28172 RepID=UPI001C2FEA34|nr:hypothetical protein [Vibrio metschnikovii]